MNSLFNVFLLSVVVPWTVESKSVIRTEKKVRSLEISEDGRTISYASDTIQKEVDVEASQDGQGVSVAPNVPTNGWSYFLQAVGQSSNKFLSHPDSCTTIDLFTGNSPSVNQRFTLVAVPGTTSMFYLQLSNPQGTCSNFLTYSSNCQDVTVSGAARTSANEGNQRFQLASVQGSLKQTLKAVGRSTCATSMVVGTNNGAQLQASDISGWWLYVAASAGRLVQVRASADRCADPFLWKSTGGKYRLVCTGGPGGNLRYSERNSLSDGGLFPLPGVLLGGQQPAWVTGSTNRWAPAVIEVPGTNVNIAVFSVQQTGTKLHRIGFAVSNTATSGSWASSSQPLNLRQGGVVTGPDGGDIDPSIFRDDDGKYYMVWKTDDNSQGDRNTRLWGQEILVTTAGLALKGGTVPRKLLDAATPNQWWVDSWVANGALVEGPELIKKGQYYYLFYATGKYCQASYAQGVARATSVWGPYEKIPVPFLHTNMMGYSDSGARITGPGHASYFQDGGNWYVAWHASEGFNCDRYAFISAVQWTADAWPYVQFNSEPARTVYPNVGRSYILKAYTEPQPCENRYVVASTTCNSVSLTNAWFDSNTNTPTDRTRITLEQSSELNELPIFYLGLSCGAYIGYNTDCGNSGLTVGTARGNNQKFRFLWDASHGWTLEAVFRNSCPNRFLRNSDACSDVLALRGQGPGWGLRPWAYTTTIATTTTIKATMTTTKPTTTKVTTKSTR